MFGLLKKSPPYKSTDKIWKTSDFTIKGLATDALKAITEGEVPVVLSFFEESKQRVMTYLHSQGVPYFDLKLETIPDSSTQHKTVFCADAFQAEYLLKNSSFDKNKIRFLFESHYPLIAPEQRVLDELHTLTGASMFTFHISIDGPLMQVFDMGNVMSIMEKLGYKDDECVEHAMVSRSILRAREKINESVPNEIKAASEKEWYDRNVRKKF
jgi:hypothetical protein